MRIVVVNNFFPPRVGGSSHLSDSLASGYAAPRSRGAGASPPPTRTPRPRRCATACASCGFPPYMLPESRVTVSFDISFATRPGLRRRLARCSTTSRPDVIHQHGQFMDLTWATGAYARRRGIPTLLSIHTRLENPAAHVPQRLPLSRRRTMVKPRLRRHQPRLVVMDSYMQDYIDSRYRGAYRDLVAIPVGVDPAWVRAGDAATRPRSGSASSPDAPLILSVGHVIPLRDRVGIVEALPAVLARHPDARARGRRPRLLRPVPHSAPRSWVSPTPCAASGAVPKADDPAPARRGRRRVPRAG